LRILFLNWKDPSDAAAGGAELYVRRVAERWAALGHDVDLMVPRGSGRAAEEVLSGVRYLRAGGARTTVFYAARRYLARKGSGYDHVVDSVSTRPFFTHELVGERGTSVYHQLADDVWPMEFPWPVSWIGRRVLEPRWLRRMARARIVSDSASTSADLLRYGLHPIALVEPGCDPAPSTPGRAMSAVPRLGFVGRLVRTKRPGDAIEAFHHIRERHPGATLDVIGDGYMRGPLAAEAGPGVTLHGPVPEADKHAVLEQLDVLLLPGTREGWGIVAIEAGVHGVPVVAYDVPGLRDSVLSGVNGVIVPPNPRAMAAAALALLGDPGRWATLAAGGRARAREHSWDRTAEELWAALQPVREAPTAVLKGGD
jgi:glycosyltransferase involved in cell wall biosynthesis